MRLAEQHCAPVTVGMPSIQSGLARELVTEIPEWALGEKSIEREFRFKDFKQAMSFVSEVAETAEREGHHPDIFISWNLVRLILSTHKIGGLSRNDFVLAAKIDALAVESRGSNV